MGLPAAIEQATHGRVEVSRGEFLRRSAGAAGLVAGLGLVETNVLHAAVAGPKPIPGGLNAKFAAVPSNAALHVLQPVQGGELSTIGDFDGFVAATEIQGAANASDGTSYSFDCDMRFMQGSYVGTDGRLRHGTFGFV